MDISYAIKKLQEIKREMKNLKYSDVEVQVQADSGPDGRPYDLRLCVNGINKDGQEETYDHLYSVSFKGKPWANWDKIKNASRKKYQVGIYCKCPGCDKSDKPYGCRWTDGTFSYTARSPEEAAWKTHEWLCSGGPYGDLCSSGWRRDILFRVKETGTPKDKGITWVKQSMMLPEDKEV